MAGWLGSRVVVPEQPGVGVVVSVDPAGDNPRVLVWYPNPACFHEPRIVETTLKSLMPEPVIKPGRARRSKP